MKYRTKTIFVSILLSFLLLNSCGAKDNKPFVEGTPLTSYKRGDFFTLKGLNFLEEISSITLNNIPIAEGQVIRNIGKNLSVIIKSTKNKVYKYSIDVIENSLNVNFKDFTYYELGKNGKLHTSKTTGSPKMLVIPVTIEGFENNANEENLKRIEKAFNGKTNDVEYESVDSYYLKSSYGKLDLDITVANKWFDSKLTPAEIHKEKDRNDFYGMGFLLNKAVDWYKTTYNSTCEEFDSDKDGFLDNVWLIYSSPNMFNYNYPDNLKDTYWAATTWHLENYSKANINSPLGYNYSYASFDFMDIGYGKNKIDTHTYIHETGHLLGLLDYYSYDFKDSMSGSIDMMDANIGDHNALSKFSLGWNSPHVIDKTTTIKIKPFEENGEFILIGGSGYSGSAFDEYFTIEYITPTGLNQLDYLNPYNGHMKTQGYSKPGIRIYHCDNRGSFNYSWSENPDEIDLNLVTNTPSFSPIYDEKNDPNSYMYQFSIMNKNYSVEPRNNPKSKDYISSDEALFFKGESFKFNPTSKFINLMPSKTNKLNKFKEEPEKFNVLDFEVNILDITPEYAELKITIN